MNREAVLFDGNETGFYSDAGFTDTAGFPGGLPAGDIVTPPESGIFHEVVFHRTAVFSAPA
jgi:hypothetical protein